MTIHKLNKRTTLFIILGSVFLTNAVLAEVIGVKIFSLERFFGFNPAQIHLFGDYHDFNLTAGVVLWPVVFITTDIINEYFGKDGVKKITYLTSIMIVYMFGFIYFATELPPSDAWLNSLTSDPNGNAFNVGFAYNSIFRQGMWIIVASLTAFLIGQLLDVIVFQYLRKRTGEKMIWLRATGSTFVSQLVDSFIVLFIAFYVPGVLSLKTVIALGIVNYIYKFGIALLLTPILYVAHFFIDRFLGDELAHQMMEEAVDE